MPRARPRRKRKYVVCGFSENGGCRSGSRSRGRAGLVGDALPPAAEASSRHRVALRGGALPGLVVAVGTARMGGMGGGDGRRDGGGGGPETGTGPRAPRSRIAGTRRHRCRPSADGSVGAVVGARSLRPYLRPGESRGCRGWRTCRDCARGLLPFPAGSPVVRGRLRARRRSVSSGVCAEYVSCDVAEEGSFAGAMRERVRRLRIRFAQKCISLELGLGRVAACWQGGRRDACLWQALARCQGVQQCVCTQAAWGS